MNRMKRLYVYVLCCVLLIATPTFAWLDSDPPEGHIESVSIPDGKIYASVTTTISTLTGTAHKGDNTLNQTEANARVVGYDIYLWWDVDKDGEAGAGDEPVGASALSAGIDGSVVTIPINSAITFRSSGAALIGTELIKYTGTTATSLTGCTRGYNETSAAVHNSAVPVTQVQFWEKVVSITTDGASDNVIGYDVASEGSDDGTEGNLLQSSVTIAVVAGRGYLAKLHVTDANGNTNTEVGDVDQLESYGVDCYLTENGDAGQGLEDDEVLRFRVNKKPRRRIR